MVAVDTNIWIYFLTGQDKKKKQIAGELISSLSPEGLVISNQIFKEIAKVLSIKMNVSLEDTITTLELVKQIAVIKPEMPKDIETALRIKKEYNLQFFDSVIYAFCLNNDIPVLISEDVPVPEIKYNNKILKVINPFKNINS